MTDAPAATTLRCPVCGSGEFQPFNGRDTARCSGCLSVERNRLAYMVIERIGLFRSGVRVLHVAPELGLMRRFAKETGRLYHPCNLNAAPATPARDFIRPLNLCTDLVKLPSDCFDLVLHSHVLEHIGCDVEETMAELERITAPGGHHILSVPVRGDITAEDLSDDLSDAERLRRFGQADHMRIFGRASLLQLLANVWGEDEDYLIEPAKMFSEEELRAAAIPEVAWSGISNHSLFMHRKAA